MNQRVLTAVCNDRKQKYDQLIFATSADVSARKLGDVATVLCRTNCEMSPVLSLLKEDGRDATSGLPQVLPLGCPSCYLWAAPVAEMQVQKGRSSNNS
nr:hypothetical protein BgiMline_006983 [Biomphalaria glabrata]